MPKFIKTQRKRDSWDISKMFGSMLGGDGDVLLKLRDESEALKEYFGGDEDPCEWKST